MQSDEPVMKGYLLLASNGKILKKTWQKKYCVLYERSSSGLARVEIYENVQRTGQAKIVTLEDVVKISPKATKQINIVTKNAIMEFETINDEDSTLWFEMLKKVAFSDGESAKNDGIEQDNELYCSVDEGVFFVKLHPSEASQRCNLIEKTYILQVTESALHLLHPDNTLLYSWPFSFIRKYGYKDRKFTFEAGRKCATGEGVFYLEHPNHNEIYRYLSAKMKQMKKKLKRAPSLTDVTESHFLPILAMEAGSRSPLPLSFTAQSSFQETSMISSLHSTFRIPSQEHLNSNKEVPQKPMRKFAPSKNDNQKLMPKNADSSHINVDEPSSTDKYDTVETRIDAWKTLGMQEPAYSDCDDRHLVQSTGEIALTEKPRAPAVISEPVTSPLSHYYDRLQHFGSTNALNINPDYKLVSANRSFENLNYPKDSLPDGEEQYISWPFKPSAGSCKAPNGTQELTQAFDEDGYDHLNFFGQTSVFTSPDYKQVVASSPLHSLKPASNLYEEINTIEPTRVADDSHLGYASIKKDSTGRVVIEDSTEESQRVAHQFQNHQPYAIISKPKRV
ncbi:hypothetical protein HUJ04_009011 [Dendroctonus ponderosae]|uniref:Insulin receptor substrate 1 n=1 Tax=Dendroctonus ponderosae TaxID=77166 RepID=A0AAR5Q535_DENPD|nr:hypothetical protein HUJ04_009011 [Dendroctonus ponderosae]